MIKPTHIAQLLLYFVVFQFGFFSFGFNPKFRFLNKLSNQARAVDLLDLNEPPVDMEQIAKDVPKLPENIKKHLAEKKKKNNKGSTKKNDISNPLYVKN